MTNQTPIEYRAYQRDMLLDFIHARFGEDDGGIFHEKTSEYVHTDIEVIAPDKEERTYVTFGMGARPMSSPLEDFQQAELVMFASPALDPYKEQSFILAGELTALSKFPFRNDTWLGPGHTIDASDKFREAFGFDAFLFGLAESTELPKIGKVNFLYVIPIYQAERDWIMENGSFVFLDAMGEALGDETLWADVPRAPFIPTPAE